MKGSWSLRASQSRSSAVVKAATISAGNSLLKAADQRVGDEASSLAEIL